MPSIRGANELALNLVGLSFYKWVLGQFPSTEAPRLASLSRNVGKDNPLKENRGETWFHADWDA